MLENNQQKRSSVLELLQFPKVVKMQQLMIEKGMPGAPAHFTPHSAQQQQQPLIQYQTKPTPPKSLENQVEALKN